MLRKELSAIYNDGQHVHLISNVHADQLTLHVCCEQGSHLLWQLIAVAIDFWLYWLSSTTGSVCEQNSRNA